MHVEVRNHVAEQLIVEMTRLEHALDRAPDVLDVQPIVGEFVWREIREGRDVSPPEHDGRVASRNGMAFEKRLADPAAVKRSAGQVGTERTANTLLPGFPVLRPGSYHRHP